MKRTAKLASVAAALALSGGMGVASPALAQIAIINHGQPYGQLELYPWIQNGPTMWATYEFWGGAAFCEGWTWNTYTFDEVTCVGSNPYTYEPIYGSGLTWWMPNW